MITNKNEPALWRFERLLAELEKLVQKNGKLSNHDIAVLLGVSDTYARQLAKTLVSRNPGRYKYSKAVLELI